MDCEMISSDIYSDQTNTNSNIHHILTNNLENETDLINFEFLNQETDQMAPDQEILDNVDENYDELMQGCNISDLLMMGAEAVEMENWFLASVAVTRLINLLSNQENGENSLGRLALYFTEGLLYKSLDSPELLEDSFPTLSTAISAFQMLQELSPYMKFAHFTANQVILEATKDCREVHVVDFDIMEGMQWPPLMVDLVTRQNACLRITAVFTDQQNSGNIQQTRIRLQEFADSVKLPFLFDGMLMTKEEDFEELEVGETLIASCMLHQLHMPRRLNSSLKIFLNGIIKKSPKVTILVENELFNLDKLPSMSFVEFFCEALQHYAAISDSLRTGFCGGYNLAVKVIEREFLRMRILESVKEFPLLQSESEIWRNEYPSLRGFKPIPMSCSNVTQAKFLVSLFNGGYWVQNDKCSLALCWKSKPLIRVSSWVPIKEGQSFF